MHKRSSFPIHDLLSPSIVILLLNETRKSMGHNAPVQGKATPKLTKAFLYARISDDYAPAPAFLQDNNIQLLLLEKVDVANTSFLFPLEKGN